jgi:hypothetical protein
MDTSLEAGAYQRHGITNITDHINLEAAELSMFPDEYDQLIG